MEESEHIRNIIAKRLSGEAAPSEMKELEAWLKKNPEDHYAFEMLRDWWEANEEDLGDKKMTDKKAKESFNRIKDRILLTQDILEEYPSLFSSRTSKFKYWPIAAVIIVLVAGFSFFLFTFNFSESVDNQATQSQVSTNYGSKSKILLPDGTSVWLNAGSDLTYNNKEFGIKNREVALTGEAYFEVTKNADIPFVIHSDQVRIKVLGTTFNVKAYPEDPAFQATLLKGSIEVSFVEKPEKKIQLKPDQTIIVYKERINPHSSKKTQNASEKEHKEYSIAPLTIMPYDSLVVETSWMENKLAFRSKLFSSLAREMARRYDVKFHFIDKEVENYRFTGIFANETLEQALKALKITAPFHYQITGSEVYISRAK